jgi:hypothetical protein
MLFNIEQQKLAFMEAEIDICSRIASGLARWLFTEYIDIDQIQCKKYFFLTIVFIYLIQIVKIPLVAYNLN